MADALGYVYRPPGSRSNLDNSGAAAVFPQSKQSPIDAYLEFFENERNREAAKERKKPYSLPSDFSGENTALGRVFDPDIVPLSKELQEIKDADIQTRVTREAGTMTDDDYVKAKNQINTAKYGTFLPRAIQSSRDRRFFDTEYPKFSANPELYPSQTRDYWQQYDELPIGQRIDPEMTKQLAQIDYSKKFNDVGMETHTTKNKVVNPDGSTTENDVTTVTPTNLRIGAERIIKDNDAYTEAMKNRYKSEFPNEQTDVSNTKFVDWVMEGIRTKKGLKVSTSYKEGRAPAGREDEGKGYSQLVQEGIVTTNVPANIKVPKANEQKDWKDKGYVSFDDAQAKRPVDSEMAAPLKGSTTIDLNVEMYDKDFQPVKRAGSIKFQPGQIKVIFNDSKNKWEAYSLGQWEDEVGGETEKGNEYKVPLRQVANIYKFNKQPYKWALDRADELNKQMGIAPSEQKTKTVSDKKIRVKRKSDGKIGTILETDFSANKYDKL